MHHAIPTTALLLSCCLTFGCDRWQAIDATVSVSPEVAAMYSESQPGLVLIEHDSEDRPFAVGALCGSNGQTMNVISHYLLPGCAEAHSARAFTALMPDDLDCDDDYTTKALFAEHPEDLAHDLDGTWIDVFADPSKIDGCWAAESEGKLSFELTI